MTSSRAPCLDSLSARSIWIGRRGSESSKQCEEGGCAGRRPQVRQGVGHLTQACSGVRDQLCDPIRAACEWVGHRHSPFARPEPGCQRFGAQRAGEGEGHQAGVAARQRLARQKIHRPEWCSRAGLLEGHRAGRQVEQPRSGSAGAKTAEAAACAWRLSAMATGQSESSSNPALAASSSANSIAAHGESGEGGAAMARSILPTSRNC